jgi:hypothetical protein
MVSGILAGLPKLYLTIVCQSSVASRPNGGDRCAGSTTTIRRCFYQPVNSYAGRVIAEDELARTVGYTLPGGTARVERYADWLLRDALGAPQTGTVHPTHAFLAAQGNVGLTLEEVFALFGASSADGPMLGEWEVEFAEPLRLDVDYAVTCVVESARRTTGARTGVFDLVTVRIELTGPDGLVHATVRPTYVFPRRAR